MHEKLTIISQRATEVARIANELMQDSESDHGELHQAMMYYRAAAVAYLADPSVSEYVRLDALRYTGQAREAVERIADLIDQLNKG